MPFKTKANKQRASLKWTTFVEGSLVAYKDDLGGSKRVNVPDKIETTKKEQKISNESDIKREIVKIALMALLVIGFQIALKFSHIGF